MPQPLVSVIVPTFNRSAFLPMAIGSVLGQTLTDLELIVVDDGSSDDTPALLEAIADGRLKVVTHPRNRGIAEARNSGLSAARGKYVAWLDSDDICRPDRVATQVRFLEKNPEVAVVGSCAGKIDRHGRRRSGVRIAPFDHEDIRCWLLFTNAFQHSTLTGRAEILKDAPYDTSFSVCEDNELFARLGRSHRLANLPHALVDRRMHDGQISRERRGHVLEAQARISAPQLTAMGVECNAQELIDHGALPRVPGEPRSEAFVQWAHEWLQRLLEANRHSRFVDADALQSIARLIRFRLHRQQGSNLLGSAIQSRFLSAGTASWLMRAAPVAISTLFAGDAMLPR
jgi:glycosyltransferase involved in cell wall biosynthesis